MVTKRSKLGSPLQQLFWRWRFLGALNALWKVREVSRMVAHPLPVFVVKLVVKHLGWPLPLQLLPPLPLQRPVLKARGPVARLLLAQLVKRLLSPALLRVGVDWKWLRCELGVVVHTQVLDRFLLRRVAPAVLRAVVRLVTELPKD